MTATKLARPGTAKRAAQDESAKSADQLRQWLKPGDTVWCILRHTAASGALRVIAPIVFVNGEPRFLCYHVAQVLGSKLDRDREGVRVQGGGMDMGAHLVEALSYSLFGNGSSLAARWL